MTLFFKETHNFDTEHWDSVVVKLVFKQQHFIEKHDLLASLQLLQVNSFCCLSHLRMRWWIEREQEGFISSKTHQDWRNNLDDKLEITNLYLHVFSYQSPSVVCGVCPVIRLQHLFGVFWIHSEIPKIEIISLFLSFNIMSRPFWPWLVISLYNFASSHRYSWRQGIWCLFTWTLIIIKFTCSHCVSINWSL